MSAYVTITDAATTLGVSRSTLRRLINRLDLTEAKYRQDRETYLLAGDVALICDTLKVDGGAR